MADGYDWLDDAFDDSKNEKELMEAQRSRNMGCILSAVIFVAVFIVALIVISTLFLGLLG